MPSRATDAFTVSSLADWIFALLVRRNFSASLKTAGEESSRNDLRSINFILATVCRWSYSTSSASSMFLSIISCNWKREAASWRQISPRLYGQVHLIERDFGSFIFWRYFFFFQSFYFWFFFFSSTFFSSFLDDFAADSCFRLLEQTNVCWIGKNSEILMRFT